MSTRDTLRAGSELAGYRLDEEIGHGGMGVVYRAHDEPLDRSVAVKLITPRLASDRGFRDRFLGEARLAASLDHPNVVPVYDAGEIDGQLYLAMRYVEGTDLRELLAAEGQLDAEQALAICGQVAAALDVAHERGLLHRDVKPSNVLLDERGHAYLADFGLTRRLTDAAPGFDAGLSLGTPAYVAPEQIEGKQTGPASDQYSLACLLYECLTGEPPYRRATEAATLYAHLEEDPPYLPHLEHVLARALAKSPDERFESCTAFVEAARGALPQTRRRRRLLAAAALATLAAAAVAAVLVFTGDDGPAVGHHWTRVPHVESVFGGTQNTGANAIASGPGGLVAVGETGSEELEQAESDAAVWTSPDGVTWTRSADPSLGGEGFQSALNVVADASGYTMVGYRPADDEARENADAAVWRSGDGRTWRSIRSDSFSMSDSFGRWAGGQAMFGVAAWPGALVVSGGFIDAEGLGSGAIWTSPDGETWRRVEPSDPRLFAPSESAPDPKWIWMWEVAASEDGTVVAVAVSGGGDDAVEGRSFGEIWVSTDGGETWARVPHDDALFGDADFTSDTRVPDSALADVAVGDAGFVAVGSDGEGDAGIPLTAFTAKPRSVRALVLTSSDGVTWGRVPDERLPEGGHRVSLETITYGPGGYVAAGWRFNSLGVANADLDAVVWLSEDGQTWVEAEDPTGAFDQPGGQLIGAITWHGDRLVAVGRDGDAKGSNTAIWLSP